VTVDESFDVVVVGAGISGIAAARELVTAGLRVAVLDMGQRIGGRMATRTMRDTGTECDGRRVDIAAAYFTASGADFAEVADRWCADGLARPWTDTLTVIGAGQRRTTTGPMRYGTPGGLRSLVEDLAAALPVGVVQSPTRVERVTSGRVECVGGQEFAARAIICAMPDPQAATIVEHPAVREVAAASEWAPVISLLSVHAERTWADFDAAFVNDHPDLALIADDGARRGDAAPVLVSHSTAPRAAQHLSDPATAAGPLTAALLELMPEVGAPVWSDTKRWSLARPIAARPEPFHWDADAGIGLCGDGWQGIARIESAWASGRDLGRTIATALA